MNTDNKERFRPEIIAPLYMSWEGHRGKDIHWSSEGPGNYFCNGLNTMMISQSNNSTTKPKLSTKTDV